MISKPKDHSPVHTMLKLVITIVASVCMLLVQSGCGEDPGEHLDEDDFSFMEEYEEPLDTDHAKLRFLIPGNKPPSWDKVKAELENRTKDKLNIELEFEWKDVNYLYRGEIDKMSASRMDYDVFVVGQPDVYWTDFTKLAREGILMDITDIFPKSAPLLYSKYTSKELEYASVDGRLYAVPSLSDMAYSMYVMADDELARKYEFDDISDFSQYEVFLKTILDNEPDRIPGIITRTFTSKKIANISGYIIADEQNMLVYKQDDPEMKLIRWEKTPEFYDVMNLMISWYQRGYIKSPKSSSDYVKAASFLFEDILEPLPDGTSKMYFNKPSGGVQETTPLRSFRLYPEHPVQRENAMGDFFNKASFVFTKGSNNTARALRFLEWVQQSRDNYYLMLNGIEGEDYVLDDGYPRLPEGMNPSFPSYMYWDWHWTFLNSEYEDTPAGSKSTESPTAKFIEMNSIYPSHKVFYPNYGSLQQVVDERSKALSEFDGMLTEGALKDPKQIDTFIDRMDKLGTDALLAEAQRQMNMGN